MTPFLQLRFWWRRAPQASRLASGLSLAIVVAVVAYLLVPTGDDGAAQLSGVDATAGGITAPGSTPVAPGVTTSSVDTGAGAAATTGSGANPTDRPPAAGPAATGTGASAGTSGCLKSTPGTPGVTDKTITVAAAILNVAGPVGNSAAGIASPDDLKKMAQAVVDDVNARGGAQCRTIALKFYEGNPLNQDQQHATCLQIAQDRPLAVVDVAAFAYPPGAYNCLAQLKVPMIAFSLVLQSEVDEFFPYLASAQSDTATVMRDVAFGLKQRGWFDPGQGFKKLGLLEDDCSPEVNRELEGYLSRVGVTTSAISKFVFACPGSGAAPPNQMTSAVQQHRLDGVTHVIPLTGGLSFNEYTNLAQAQGFKPKYAITDYDGLVLSSVGQAKPNPDNLDGAISITTTRFGQESTPGVEQDPATRRCQAILTKAGYSSDFVFQKGGGIVCSVLWVAENAIDSMSSLTREALLPGLFRRGPVQLPFPSADSAFTGPRKLHGGDTWWPIEWQKGCGCWRALDTNRKPSFAP